MNSEIFTFQNPRNPEERPQHTSASLPPLIVPVSPVLIVPVSPVRRNGGNYRQSIEDQPQPPSPLSQPPTHGCLFHLTYQTSDKSHVHYTDRF